MISIIENFYIISNHEAKYRIGRYRNVVEKQRHRPLSAYHNPKDEFQFILKCLFHSDIRNMYLKKLFSKTKHVQI